MAFDIGARPHEEYPSNLTIKRGDRVWKLQLSAGAVEIGTIIFSTDIDFQDDESLYDAWGNIVELDFEVDTDNGDATFEIRKDPSKAGRAAITSPFAHMSSEEKAATLESAWKRAGKNPDSNN